MKAKYFSLVMLLLPVLAFSQTERKSWYANLALGYGSYKLDLYNYNGGSNNYAD